jgi:hypothetical protein
MLRADGRERAVPDDTGANAWAPLPRTAKRVNAKAFMIIKWDKSDGKERKVTQQAVIVRTSKISMEDLVPR